MGRPAHPRDLIWVLVATRFVPRRSGSIGPPADYCHPFPDGVVAVDAPIGVASMVGVALRLRAALSRQARSVSKFARSAGVDRTTVHDILAGRTMIDVVTLARLERAVGEPLWESAATQSSPPT